MAIVHYMKDTSLKYGCDFKTRMLLELNLITYLGMLNLRSVCLGAKPYAFVSLFHG